MLALFRTTLQLERRYLQKRMLGKTGQESTIVSFGTAGIGHVTQEVANGTIELVLQHEINHIDIAPTYGEAMERLNPWIPQIRDQIFLGGKTAKRTKHEAWDEIEDSRRRLGVDCFDLFQLHAVTTSEDLAKATDPGGSLEALIQMRDRGLTKFIGITGHGPEAPRLQIKALNSFDFDTIMFPISASIYRNSDYRRDADALIALAHKKNVGIQTIKMIARGGWGDRQPDCTTWYDPHRDQEEIDDALWWVLSQPIHTAPSVGDVELLPKVLDAARRFQHLSKEQQETIITQQHPPIPEPNLGILAAG